MHLLEYKIKQKRQSLFKIDWNGLLTKQYSPSRNYPIIEHHYTVPMLIMKKVIPMMKMVVIQIVQSPLPYECGKFTNPQTSGNVEGIPVNNTNNDVSVFEEYYEDENGEDTPDNDVIDMSNIDSPKYQFAQNSIDPFRQQQKPPNRSDNANDNTNYGSSYDSNYGQISP